MTDATPSPDRGMYSILPKRAFKIISAAAKPEDHPDLCNLQLERIRGRLRLTACNGHCMVLIDVAADQSLFESGHKLLIPHDLAKAVAAGASAGDDTVEVVDLEAAVKVTLPNGIDMERAKTSTHYPDTAAIIRQQKTPDMILEIKTEPLRTAINAIIAASNPARITFRVSAGSQMLNISAQDDDMGVTAIVSGAETTIVEMPAKAAKSATEAPLPE